MKLASSSRRPGLLGPGLSLVLLVAHGLSAPARADVTLPNVFGDHMVLQQKQKDRVWGKAAPDEEVTVTIADQSKTARADKGRTR